MDGFLKQAAGMAQEYLGNQGGNQNQGQNQGHNQGQGQGQGNYGGNDNSYQDNLGDGYGGSGGRQGHTRPPGDDDRRNQQGGYSQEDAYNNRQQYGDDSGQGRQDNYGGANYDDNRGGRNTQGGYSQQDANQGGQYNEIRPPQQGGGHGPGGYGQGGQGYSDDDSDLQGAHHTAVEHAGREDSDMFTSALGFLQGKKQQGDISGGVNENHMMQAHQDAYNNDASQDAGSIGSAAALQALKKFTGGQSNAGPGAGGSGAFVGMAMSEASKLFNQKSNNGQVASGDKQSAINSAAEMAFKMYMQSQGGSGGGGGMGGLMSMASKFM